MLELTPTFLLVLLACLGAGRMFLNLACSWGMANEGRKRTVANPMPFLARLETDGRPGEVLFRAGFEGLCGMSLLAFGGGLLNLVIPLNGVSVWVLFALALWALIRWPGRPSRWESVAAVLLFLAALAFSSREVLHGDTGNYHHQAVLWMSRDVLPLGLANLHGRFGFNSSWWIVGSWMELPWLKQGASIYLPTGVLGFFYGLIFVGALARLFDGRAKPAEILVLCSGYLWFRQLSGINNPSFSTDAPANLFIVASAAALVRALSDPSGSRRWLWVWCLLASSAATFKLTALPWFGLSFLAVFASPLGWPETKKRWARFLPLAVCFLIGGLIIGTYAVRGAWISGFPFYPTRLLVMGDFPWSVPQSTLVGDTDGIRNWPTRGEGGGLAGFVWRWISNQFGLTNILFGVGVMGLGAGFLALVVRGVGLEKTGRSFRPFVPVLAAAILGLTVCFLYAPALRFVSGYFFVTMGLLVAILAQCVPWQEKRGLRHGVMAAFLIGAILPNLRGAVSLPVSVLVCPPLPKPQVEERTTLQGEVIRVNVGGFSWAVHPPATPYFTPELIIVRDANGRIRGFVLPEKRIR